MVNNNVGAVTADIRLNTKDFEEAVKKLKGDVKEIKESFNQKTSGNKGLLEEVKTLKKEIESLREKTDSYRNTIKNLREQNADYAKGIENLNKLLEKTKKEHANFNAELKKEQQNLDNASRSAKKYVSLQDRMTKFSMKTAIGNLKDKGMGSLFSLGAGSADFSQWIKSLNKGQARIGFKSDGSVERELANQSTLIQKIREGQRAYVQYNQRVMESIALERQRWSQTGGITGYINLINQMRQAMNKVSNVKFNLPSDNIYKNGELIRSMGTAFTEMQEKLKIATTVFKFSLKEVDGELVTVATEVGRVTDVLNKFNFTLLDSSNYWSAAGENATKLASAMHKMNAQGTANWQGRQTNGGYSNYISQSNNIAQSLKKQAQSAKEAKLATEGLSQAYRKTNLNTYKANINQINKALEQQKLRTAQLKVAQENLAWKHRTDYLTQYKMNMNEINRSLERQTGTHRKNNQEIKRGQMSMREFGTTMGKAEAYSNNLYRGLQKVRSVIVSFKTIMGAMGGMAVWNFAFGLIDKAKETYNAKNEMESILNKNSKVNAEGVQTFNKALDETVERFQRINKYSLGETAAEIGLEFELNAKEMAKSLDVIAMVQNEYIRAGRTTEEAALAVKDILQGEFMRLSRETGVGKDDLIEKYGWNGKTEDVQDLMKALEKAGKSRHWDLFAEKATSVNDVITITQYRFGEFGADLLTNAEPMIVGAFNLILGAVDSLKKGFESMGTFGKYFTVGTTGIGVFTTLSTALMMFKRDMGLAQIATLGWGKSFFTALLGLNKTEVAMHGFRKTLIATISGTKASELANVRASKALLGRVLGVNQLVLKEKGLMTALVHSRAVLKGEAQGLEYAAMATGNFRQKLIYLTSGTVVANKEAATYGKTIKSVITSTKLLRIALVGLVSVGVIAWFASIAQWADTVKQRMETYKDVLSNGKQDIKDATDDLKNYESQLSKLSKNDKKYSLVKSNRDTVQNHINDLKLSLKLAKQIKKTDKEITKAHDTTFQGLLDKTYAENGVEIEKYGQTYLQMKQAAYDMQHAEDERYRFLYRSSQHINEQVAKMKEAKVSEEDRVKYITEYSAKAQEAAENIKKFNQGDINAGAYYLINRAQLMWIDLWNNQHFIKFWESVKKTWEDVKPSLYAMKDTLIGIGEGLADFFATDMGRWIGAIALFGGGIGLVVGKMSKWLTGNNLVLTGLKKLGSSLVERIKDWKGMGKAAEEANTKSTGGITPEGKVNKPPSTKGEWWQDTKGKIYQDSTKYARAAVGIAAGMLLISEAVLMLNAPMWSLAQTGKYFKSVEPHVREGIEGLKLIAPLMMVLLPPVIALSYVFEKYGVEAGTIAKGAWKAAVGIAAGMLLVAEAVVMMNAPLLAIASVGYTFTWQKDAVLRGKEALQLVTDCLVSLAPTIPIFIGGIALMALVFAAPEVGLPVLGAVALGIGAGMLLVAEAIIALNLPLAAIAQTGQNYPNLDGVRQGAEAIKITAEALGYVNDAMTSLTGINLNLLAQSIEEIVASWFGVDLGTKLTDLTKEGGVLDQLNSFVKVFNSDSFTIEAPNPDKVTALGLAGDGIKTIGDAMSKVKTAMNNLPDEFKNGGTGNGTPAMSYDMKNNTTSINNGDVEGYFDQFKEPIRQLKTFIEDFNNSEEFNIEKINQDRVANLSTAASMIETVKQAVDKVKTTMQGIGDSGSATAFAQGGWIGQAGYNLFHMTGLDAINNGQSSGNYKSSLGTQLQEMEDVIDDLFTFQSNISSKGSGATGENANVSGATALVTQIQDAISKVSSSLSNAVPQFEGKGNALSQALLKGLNNGLNGVTLIGGRIVNQLANGIMTNKERVYATATSLGKTSATRFQTGINPMSTYMTNELNYVKQAMLDKQTELGNTAYNLGSHIANRFKEGDDINSPGIMARSMQDEVGYIRDALSVNNLPQMAYNLANSLATNFQPNLNLGDIQLPDVTQWTSKLSTVIPTVTNLKTQVSTNFTAMKTNVQNSFTNIVAKTRSSLANMKTATISHIGNIKTSWHGMQSALIASAENIKKQTGEKINNLKTNMASFWKKIQNPSTLIAGGHTGSIKRRGRPKISTPKGQYAGGFNWKPKRSTGGPDESIVDYLKCLLETGKPCYAGGWSFNWNKPIQGKLNGWNTHFGKFHIDDYLKVGKFYNNSFPARGIKEIAKAYIFDTIRATNYKKYFNSNYGDDPVSALNAGAFNCWDGTNIVLAIARAFGFDGSRGHGTWNGIGHVWANIPGLGIIDPTAIQQNGSFTSSAVKGYSAGSIRRGEAKRKVGGGDTHNHKNEVHIHIEGDVYGIDDLDKRIDDGANRVARRLFRNSYTGV